MASLIARRRVRQRIPVAAPSARFAMPSLLPQPSAPVAVAAPVAAAPVADVEPMPARYDAVYHLDAGDKLRVVVYGQEGLTNTYAIDAGGSITMPLIGSVPARGRTPAGLAGAVSAGARGGFTPGSSGSGGNEGQPPIFIPWGKGGAR